MPNPLKLVSSPYKQGRFPGIDYVINNAGITKDQLAMAMSPADFANVINANLNGTFNVTQPIFKKMIRQRMGAIVHEFCDWFNG